MHSQPRLHTPAALPPVPTGQESEGAPDSADDCTQINPRQSKHPV
jgi:hypothetical protein